MDVGIDGAGPQVGQWIAEDARRGDPYDRGGDLKIARKTVARGAIGGFVASVGGFVTMPIALPVNVVEFYVQPRGWSGRSPPCAATTSTTRWCGLPSC